MAAPLELLNTSPCQVVPRAERKWDMGAVQTKFWDMGGYCQWESDGTTWSATTNSA
jgi:hypothetical protein